MVEGKRKRAGRVREGILRKLPQEWALYGFSRPSCIAFIFMKLP
jgi:hypothetical protein